MKNVAVAGNGECRPLLRLANQNHDHDLRRQEEYKEAVARRVK